MMNNCPKVHLSGETFFVDLIPALLACLVVTLHHAKSVSRFLTLVNGDIAGPLPRLMTFLAALPPNRLQLLPQWSSTRYF